MISLKRLSLTYRANKQRNNQKKTNKQGSVALSSEQQKETQEKQKKTSEPFSNRLEGRKLCLEQLFYCLRYKKKDKKHKKNRENSQPNNFVNKISLFRRFNKTNKFKISNSIRKMNNRRIIAHI